MPYDLVPVPEPVQKPIRKLNKRTKKLLNVLRSLRKGQSIVQACKNSDVGTCTFWKWRKAEPRIAALCEAIMESRIQMVEDALFTACLERNMTGIIFFLTNRHHEKWQDRRALVNNTNIFSAKIEGDKDGQANTIDATFKRIDDLRASLIPPSNDD